jgi:TfoX/Sxy family transcriptional regulator of competence genes
MAYDEKLAGRIREIINSSGQFTEKKMFGGIAFMLNGNMCLGVLGDLLMARVGPGQYEASLTKPHVQPMDFTGKPMKGYVYVEPAGYKEDIDLKVWVDRCVDFVSTLPGK